MRLAFPRLLAVIPVCRQEASRLAAIREGNAERAEEAEGKIKETGTTSGRFLKLLLSAHWLAGPRAAPWFLIHSAAIVRKVLAPLDFDRHHSPKSGGFPRFGPVARL